MLAAPIRADGAGLNEAQRAAARLEPKLQSLYALVAGAVKFPLGAGYVAPTWVMLVPMLLLLPPLAVPALAAGALVLSSAVRCASRRCSIEHVLFSVSDAWHALGPALVLAAAGRPHGPVETPVLYLAAFLAGCLVVTVPMLLVFLRFQDALMRGTTAGAVRA